MEQVRLEESSNVTTTVGELIELISRIALESAKTEKEAYKIAAMVLQDMTKNSKRPIRIDA